MDIINGLHGLGIALAVVAGATLVTLFFATAETGNPPRHSAKIAGGALFAAVVGGFLIGATA